MRVGVVTSVFWNLSTDSEKLWCQTSLECLKCTDEVSAAVFEILKPSDQQVSFIKTVGIIEYRKCFSNGSIPVLNHKYISEVNKLAKWNLDEITTSIGVCLI